ncbi:hypothetical protein Pmar_PMAR029353 [Perkinsus marinus ATCC 50983]|uniref:Uncharacterized protein n=1 Tax=Perkinsus marinus (strain ATCC 50983 / TXsc) TaxID=423536 RepID=C5KMX3_PERM5|nr:hypothetical protein Pmar_PMAR029353 [Perkinsus marinus ATCC 50983]EER14281.1 hypothetical protein Pmar_PMAR029353 [Perkinsus marinus ATCC 50983]|eukprot:XP_002782486.1 hypothetical protein Pmar_PMAR029353 [Perkinsus marinus ATCC 50983]
MEFIKMHHLRLSRGELLSVTSSNLARVAVGVVSALVLGGGDQRYEMVILKVWGSLLAHLPPPCGGAPQCCSSRMDRLKRCLRGLHEIHVHVAVNPHHNASQPMLERCASQSYQLSSSRDIHENLNREAQSLLDVCNSFLGAPGFGMKFGEGKIFFL